MNTTPDTRGIQIKGRAKEEELEKKKKLNTLKNDINIYLHAKKRIDVYLRTRQDKLAIIIPQLKEELHIIRRKHNNINTYNNEKDKYIRQYISQKHIAKAFIKKHLRNS